MKKLLIKKDAYFDSVSLMLMSKELKTTSGVTNAIVAMGTPMNIDLIKSMGFDPMKLAEVTPNDLITAIEGSTDEIINNAIIIAEQILTNQNKNTFNNKKDCEITSINAAVQYLPEANLAVISLPGEYAKREAKKALEAGLHVMLFSDNVSLDDEITLKKIGQKKGLLVMGPDCGTAIINGKPICFANLIRRGPIGLVGASGTGIQEITCLIDRAQSGISQAIGTGGRDLKNEQIGGITMLMGIQALAQDNATKVIVVVSKPPAKSIAEKVIATLEKTGKPSVVLFIGLETSNSNNKYCNINFASNLEEAANMAVALANGKNIDFEIKSNIFQQNNEDIIARETKNIKWTQKFIRGYYTGGTLADETWLLLHKLTGKVFSNNQTDENFLLPDPKTSIGHTVVDLGDDIFTVGRPHPMIDPSTRTDRITAEKNDETIAVVIVDVVLGYGSHQDPAGALIPALLDIKNAAKKRGGYLPIIASITGTQADFQNFKAQKDKLEEAGCVVMPSNYQASMLAVKILERLKEINKIGKEGI